MLTVIAYGLTVLLALAIIAIGLRFFFAPSAAATGYGIPAGGGGIGAYLAVKGLRDLTYGILGLVLLAAGGAYVMGWFMAIAALVPVGDALIVLRNGGRKAVAFGIHLATAAAMLVAAILLFAI